MLGGGIRMTTSVSRNGRRLQGSRHALVVSAAVAELPRQDRAAGLDAEVTRRRRDRTCATRRLGGLLALESARGRFRPDDRVARQRAGVRCVREHRARSRALPRGGIAPVAERFPVSVFLDACRGMVRARTGLICSCGDRARWRARRCLDPIVSLIAAGGPSWPRLCYARPLSDGTRSGTRSIGSDAVLGRLLRGPGSARGLCRSQVDHPGASSVRPPTWRELATSDHHPSVGCGPAGAMLGRDRLDIMRPPPRARPDPTSHAGAWTRDCRRSSPPDRARPSSTATIDQPPPPWVL